MKGKKVYSTSEDCSERVRYQVVRQNTDSFRPTPVAGFEDLESAKYHARWLLNNAPNHIYEVWDTLAE